MAVNVAELVRSAIFDFTHNRITQPVDGQEPVAEVFLDLSQYIGFQQMAALCDPKYHGYVQFAYQKEDGIYGVEFSALSPETLLIALEVMTGIKEVAAVENLNQTLFRRGLRAVLLKNDAIRLHNLSKTLTTKEMQGLIKQYHSAKMTYLEFALNGPHL